MKCYGDTWGCWANTDKTHFRLVGQQGAVAATRHHDFCWCDAPLQVVDRVKYLGVRLNCACTWIRTLLPPTARDWESFMLGGQWCPRASELLPNYASSIWSSARFGSMAWRSGAHMRTWSPGRGSEEAHTRLPLCCTLINSFSPRVVWFAASAPSPGEPGWTRRACVSPEVLLLCVKCCPVKVRVS
jgi:hypothetical protein